MTDKTERQLIRASEAAGQQLYKFIDYLQFIDPLLTRTEATYLAASILDSLPQLFIDVPVLLDSIKQKASYIISKRNEK